MPSFSGMHMVKTNDDGACLRLAHAQVENEIPARPRRAPRRGAREYRRLRAFPIWGIHIQTKSTVICACLRLAHAQVENEIPARPRRAPRRGAREYRRLRAFPIWGIHIQTKSTFICGINGVGGGGGKTIMALCPTCIFEIGLRERTDP